MLAKSGASFQVPKHLHSGKLETGFLWGFFKRIFSHWIERFDNFETNSFLKTLTGKRLMNKTLDVHIKEVNLANVTEIQQNQSSLLREFSRLPHIFYKSFICKFFNNKKKIFKIIRAK
jgi:hypothetical protein